VSVALVIQQAMRMRPIILDLWPLWLLPTFPHYLTKGTILVKKVIEHKIFVLIFSTTFI